jgi:hypothetical protein
MVPPTQTKHSLLSAEWSAASAVANDAPAAASWSWRNRFMVAAHAVLNSMAPVGYQDKTGFHFGRPVNRSR